MHKTLGVMSPWPHAPVSMAPTDACLERVEVAYLGQSQDPVLAKLACSLWSWCPTSGQHRW